MLPATWETEAGELRVPGQLGLHSETLYPKKKWLNSQTKPFESRGFFTGKFVIVSSISLIEIELPRLPISS
jgi:hypothetical protein